MSFISIVVISDTHNKHKLLKNLPEADIIIHCGDMTSMGYEHEIINFMKWYSNLNQYNHKIIIAGNHDWLFETEGLYARSLVPENVIYLEDSGIDISGLYFYGSPVSEPFNNWAFNRPKEKLAQHWKAIPDNTDVLITHSPAYLVMDYVPHDWKHHGSPSLYKEIVERIKPLIHITGHIHEGRGTKMIQNILFVNATNLNEDYLCIYKPILIEIDDNKTARIVNY